MKIHIIQRGLYRGWITPIKVLIDGRPVPRIGSDKRFSVEVSDQATSLQVVQEQSIESPVIRLTEHDHDAVFAFGQPFWMYLDFLGLSLLPVFKHKRLYLKKVDSPSWHIKA